MPIKGLDSSKPTGEVVKNSFYIPTTSTHEAISRDIRINSMYRDQPEEEMIKGCRESSVSLVSDKRILGSEVEKGGFYNPTTSTPEAISRDIRINSMYRDQPENKVPSMWRCLVVYFKDLIGSIFGREE